MDELRTALARELELPEWPGDWQALEAIFQACALELTFIAYSKTYIARAISPDWYISCASKDPLEAIYRAFISLTWSQSGRRLP